MSLKPGVQIGAFTVLGLIREAERIRFAYGANFDRLVTVKAKYDPDNFFRANQNLATVQADVKTTFGRALSP